MHLNQNACWAYLMPAQLTNNHFAIWAANVLFGHNRGTGRRLCCVFLDDEHIQKKAIEPLMGSLGDLVKNADSDSLYLEWGPENLHF